VNFTLFNTLWNDGPYLRMYTDNEYIYRYFEQSSEFLVVRMNGHAFSGQIGGSPSSVRFAAALAAKGCIILFHKFFATMAWP
ncbi:hypothetical protein PFISCL1PPCAC_7683, partial [Pristionchus fissidentatus]